MRELTDKEKYIVKGLFDRKSKFYLEELHTTKLLRDNLDCFALRWDLTPRKIIKIYMKKEDAEDITELNKQYFKICDFLYFMNELEENHYIKLQTISFANNTSKLQEQALYDTSKYQYGLPKDIEYSGNLDYFYEIADKGKRLYAVEHIEQNAYTDCVDLLNKYYDKIIYPLPLLEDLVKHEYKSIEQRNFEKQINKTSSSLAIAALALITSATIPFLVDQCTPPTKMDNIQLKTIEQAIINSKNTYPSTIYIQSSDTQRIKIYHLFKNK